MYIKGEKTPGYSSWFKFGRTQEHLNSHICISEDTTNCKLSYIHGGGSLLIYNEEEIQFVINHILSFCKGCIILNTIYKKVYDVISKHYPIYYKSEVPIGYNGGFQYHVCFKNIIRKNSSCREPTSVNLDKKRIKDVLTSVLKKKRRKSDYVDEFINLL